AALGRLGRAKGAEADVRESPFLLVTLCYLTGLRLTGALRRPCNTVLLAGDQRERRLGKQRDALLEPRRAGVLLRQLAANEPAVDRLAEHRGLPERERLEPLERLDVAAALDGVAVGELTPRGEPRQRGDRRGAQRIRLAAGLAVGGEQVADVGARVADGAHLPVEDGADARRPVPVEDHVAEPVVAV